MKDPRRQGGFVFRGGLDLETPGLAIQPGRMLACQNYEVDVSGGYTRTKGYERFDGQPSPAEADTFQDKSTRRGNIDAVPGSGPVRGVHEFNGTVYAWRDNEAGTELLMYESTSNGWSQITTGVTLSPGGRIQAINYTFKATDADRKMIGCDGVNAAFIYDGTNYTQITVEGETSDVPQFCAAMKNYLFLLFAKGVLYYSAVGDPSDFTSANNAGVIGVGGTAAGLHVTVNGSLAILMRERITFLYGTGPSDFGTQGLREFDSESGAFAYSSTVFDSVYFVGQSGLTTLAATEKYGDFRSASLSGNLYPFFRDRSSTVIGAFPMRGKNQIRVVFPDQKTGGSEVMTYTFSGQDVTGWGRQIIPERISCLAEAEPGIDTVYAGTDSGLVIQMDKGNSHDGDPVVAYIRSAFWFGEQPQIEKQFMRAVLSIQAQENLTIRVKPQFNYGDPAVATHPYFEYDLSGGASIWNEGEWNEFTWSQPLRSEVRSQCLGNARAVSFLVYSESDDIPPHTIYDAVITYKPRRQRR